MSAQRKHAKLLRDDSLWAIKGRWPSGKEFFFHGTWGLRRSAIREHCEMSGITWAHARRRGHRCVRVVVTERAP